MLSMTVHDADYWDLRKIVALPALPPVICEFICFVFKMRVIKFKSFGRRVIPLLT